MTAPRSLRPSMRASDVDAHQRRVIVIAAVVLGLVFSGIGFPLGVLVGVPSAWLPVCAILFGGLVGLAVYKMTAAIVGAAGRGALAIVQPSGDSTPYEREFSAHQAMVASGEIEEAIAAYDRTMAQQPTNVAIRRQAIELHYRQGDPRRAESLLVELRRNPGATRTDELYATQRLVDLYLGALGDEGRALVELRRIAERFPGTPEAAGARRAIAALKERASAP